jgi:DNA mismatch repair protein MLH1
VVNRIAAGEIIIAPANALKELLENAMDAGASKIDVVVKDGGLKFLQITDDGTGIHKDDLPLLCQRFATSKIEKFEDLEQVQTYGFRGEALASISHISQFSVITKTKESACAWKATYQDGELKDVKPTAGKQGTQIVVENLFYNVPSRLKALKGGSEEFSKIVDVVGRYAIHTDLGFGVKKFGDSHFTLTTRPNLSVRERIRSVYGNSVAQELVEFSVDGIEKYGVVNVQGQITNPNYNNKKSIAPVFFINNRLVSNDRLRRSLNSTIQHFLPKGHKPFVYLGLTVNPDHLDVNVHPTKREVRFLHEDEIIDEICVNIRETFINIDSSRSFPTRSLLSHVQKRSEEDAMPQPMPQKKSRLDYKLVRTDSLQAKITNYIRASEHPSQVRSSEIISSRHADDETTDDSVMGSSIMTTTAMTTTLPIANNKPIYQPLIKERVAVNLQSILDLRATVQGEANEKLTELVSMLTYIGIVESEKRLCTVQHGVKLMLLDYGALFSEFFYQLGLQDFNNFGVINLEGHDLTLRGLLQHVYDSKAETNVSIDECIEKLTSMNEMLEEYFSIKVTQDDEPRLSTLPLLVKGYLPPLTKLPHFLYKIGAKVNWDDEKSCLDGILHQLALLYVPSMIPEMNDDSENSQIAQQQKLELNETLENVLMPLVKRRFLAPNSLRNHVIEIANLPGLYRVFERC